MLRSQHVRRIFIIQYVQGHTTCNERLNYKNMYNKYHQLIGYDTVLHTNIYLKTKQNFPRSYTVLAQCKKLNACCSFFIRKAH